jgi:AcrR family transcriptional regulator
MHAMVQLVRTRGYVSITGADLIELAGVSRKTLYAQFDNREDLLVATFSDASGAMLGQVRAATSRLRDSRSRMEALASTLCSVGFQAPGTIGLCAHDIAAAGSRGLGLRAQRMRDYANVIQDGGGDGASPSSPATVLAGAFHRAIQASLLADEGGPDSVATEIARWTRCYYPIPPALRSATEPARRWPSASGSSDGLIGGRAPGTLSLAKAGLPPLRRPSRQFVAHATRERIIDAVAQINADKGHAALNPGAIVEHAGLPPRAFREHFSDPDDAFAAALELGHAKGQSIAERACAGGADWVEGVCDALHALLEFFASEPRFTQLAFIDAPVLGPEMLRRTYEHAQAYSQILFDGGPRGHRPPANATELIAHALFELIFCHAAQERTAQLTRASATATYLALAPFLGAHEARQAATR